MELVEEEVLDALRPTAAHGSRPQVAAQRRQLAAERDHLQLEHEPGRETKETDRVDHHGDET